MNPLQKNSAVWSIRTRLLASATLVVVCFTALTGLAIDRAFQNSVMQLNHERMQARIYMLIGAATFDAQGRLRMPEVLPEPGLSSPGSGIYASISDGSGRNLWISESSLGADVYYPPARKPGVAVTGISPSPGGGSALTRALPVIWEASSDGERVLIFQTAQDRAGIDAEVSGFRTTLLTWLGGAALLLLAFQATVLIWSLAPIRRVADEVRRIELGRQDMVRGRYPRELSPLTDNLNAFIESRQNRMRRYRNALADLAHSLKTPLAILRGHAGETGGRHESVLFEQIDRMQNTIDHQLQRAATSGRSPLAAPIEIEADVRRIVESVRKLYRDRALQIETDIPPGTTFNGDAADLAELTGNLLDNACKWARSSVRISARNETDDDAGAALVLQIDDDGPGIADELRERMLRRGERGDTQVPGHGIGLAIVREMVEDVYHGKLCVDIGPLGGARITLRI